MDESTAVSTTAAAIAVGATETRFSMAAFLCSGIDSANGVSNRVECIILSWDTYTLSTSSLLQFQLVLALTLSGPGHWTGYDQLAATVYQLYNGNRESWHAGGGPLDAIHWVTFGPYWVGDKQESIRLVEPWQSWLVQRRFVEMSSDSWDKSVPHRNNSRDHFNYDDDSETV